MANKDIPYIVFESEMTRMERVNRRLWILAIILVAIIVITNALWIWYESQFQYFETEVIQENEDGYNSFIGEDGDIYNGYTESSSEG